MNKKLGFLALVAMVSLTLKWAFTDETSQPAAILSPLALHLYPQNQEAKAGEMVTWYLTAAGAEPLQYQWKLNGKALVGGQTNTLRIGSVRSTDQGIYVCSIKNKFGSYETEPVQLSLLSQGAISTAQKINVNRVPPSSTAKTTTHP